MPSRPQRIEVVLETLIESIALAEEVGVRVAAAAGFDEDDQYKIGLAVHEGVMNAFQYGNEQRRLDAGSRTHHRKSSATRAIICWVGLVGWSV